MSGAVGLVIQTLGAYMMMIFSVLLRMTETVIKTRTLPEVCVAVPDVLVIIGLAIIHIKNAHAIGPYANVSQANGSGSSHILLRVARNFKNKILVGSHIRITCPRPDVVSRYARAAN